MSNLSSTSAALPAVSEQADSEPEPVMFAGAAEYPPASASKKQKVITQNADFYSRFKETGEFYTPKKRQGLLDTSKTIPTSMLLVQFLYCLEKERRNLKRSPTGLESRLKNVPAVRKNKQDCERHLKSCQAKKEQAAEARMPASGQPPVENVSNQVDADGSSSVFASIFSPSSLQNPNYRKQVLQYFFTLEMSNYEIEQMRVYLVKIFPIQACPFFLWSANPSDGLLKFFVLEPQSIFLVAQHCLEPCLKRGGI